MFLLRSAFWLAAVVLLLPSDPTTGTAPRVTVFQAIDAGRAVIVDFGQFCERNPEVCVTGSAAFAVLLDKARHGVDMVVGRSGKDGRQADGANSRGTLTEADTTEPWRAPRAPGQV